MPKSSILIVVPASQLLHAPWSTARHRPAGFCNLEMIRWARSPSCLSGATTLLKQLSVNCTELRLTEIPMSQPASRQRRNC